MTTIIAQKMIVLEDSLTEMFDCLPEMKYKSSSSRSYKPTFGYGDDKEMNLFLKTRKEAESPYPLIWLLYPYEEEHDKRKLIVEDVILILAVKTNSAMRNPQRLAETYKNVLKPLFENIRELLKRANTVNMANNYKLKKRPNISKADEREKHAGNLVWDALRVKFDLVITDTCFKKVTFL